MIEKHLCDKGTDGFIARYVAGTDNLNMGGGNDDCKNCDGYDDYNH